MSLSMRDVQHPQQTSTPDRSLHLAIGVSWRLDKGTKEEVVGGSCQLCLKNRKNQRQNVGGRDDREREAELER